MKGRRIILAVTNDLTYDRRMFRICSSLAAAGASVLLVGRRFKYSKSFAPGLFEGKRFRCFFNKGFLFYKEYNIRLFLYLLTKKFDAACACDLDTALPVFVAAKLKKKKSVYDAHEFFTEVPELIHRPGTRKIWDLIGKLTIPGFHQRYTVGQELALLMKERYGSDFHVIRNIPSISQSSDESVIRSGDKKILFYQGALNIGRGLETCLKSIRELQGWEFWIAGEGDITEQLKQLSREYGIENRVWFLGWVKPEDLPRMMSQVYLGINLRESGSLNDYYSLPNKFFDFIHSGLPSINMNYPEYNHVVSKHPCSVLIDEVNSEKIISAIQTIDSDPVLYTSLVEGCHSAAKEYTWNREEERLISLYKDLLV